MEHSLGMGIKAAAKLYNELENYGKDSGEECLIVKNFGILWVNVYITVEHGHLIKLFICT